MSWLIESCGIIGSAVAFIMFVPQALRCWKMRANPEALAGVSMAGMAFLLFNALLWAIYGLGSGAVWTAVPFFFNAPLAIVVLILLYRAQGQRKTVTDAEFVSLAAS